MYGTGPQIWEKMNGCVSQGQIESVLCFFFLVLFTEASICPPQKWMNWAHMKVAESVSFFVIIINNIVSFLGACFILVGSSPLSCTRM